MYGLSTKEYQVANATLQSLCEKRGCGATLEFLLESWPDFVKRVEQGYRISINDYANDLDGRQILEQLLSELPEAIRTKIAEVLQPWDRMFIEATLEVSEHVFPPWSTDVPTYRYYRVPKNLDIPEDDYDFQEWSPFYTNLR